MGCFLFLALKAALGLQIIQHLLQVIVVDFVLQAKFIFAIIYCFEQNKNQK
jgi:hypothetical protein